jgi:hypothetical protein
MTSLRQRLLEGLKLRGCAARTQEAYVAAASSRAQPSGHQDRPVLAAPDGLEALGDLRSQPTGPRV